MVRSLISPPPKCSALTSIPSMCTQNSLVPGPTKQRRPGLGKSLKIATVPLWRGTPNNNLTWKRLYRHQTWHRCTVLHFFATHQDPIHYNHIGLQWITTIQLVMALQIMGKGGTEFGLVVEVFCWDDGTQPDCRTSAFVCFFLFCRRQE